MTNMTYLEAIQYLESFINYELMASFAYKESFRFERIQAFLKMLDEPQINLRAIHIAGTKGKGSTAAFVSYILKEAGYSVGLYTSPHLSDFRERIRILKKKPVTSNQRPGFNYEMLNFEGMISEEDLVFYVGKLKPLIEEFNKTSEFEDLTFFEVYTALALVYFKEKKVDFAVLETGLGGRLDATNVVNPLVSAITNISYDHTWLLGATLKEIATEKAGIIKQKGQIVISAMQEKEAEQVIKNRCKEFQAKLYFVGKDIKFKAAAAQADGQVFNIEGIYGKYDNLKIKLLGSHQLINAAAAIGVIEALKDRNIDIPQESIRKGLESAVWPGRFEIISKEPYIVLDGAQNVLSSKALVDTLKATFNAQKKILVLGISQDKDVEGICDVLDKAAGKVILTRSSNPRASNPKDLQKYFKRDKIIGVAGNVKDALTLARTNSQKEDVIVVTGSLYVVGEARSLIYSAKLKSQSAKLKRKT